MAFPITLLTKRRITIQPQARRCMAQLGLLFATLNGNQSMGIIRRFLTYFRRIRAETIISACAVATLAFAIYQNQQTSHLLQSAYYAFEASVYPTIGFDHYQWNVTSSGLSCETPPHGVNVYYRKRHKNEQETST
jgi:hypothetical protein